MGSRNGAALRSWEQEYAMDRSYFDADELGLDPEDDLELEDDEEECEEDEEE